MSWPRMALALVLLGTLAAPAAEPEQKPAEEKQQPQILAEFKIEKGGRLILLPVTIGGQPHSFVLDTGMSWNCFDSCFKPKGPLDDTVFKPKPETVRMMTVAGVVEREVSEPPEAFLGKLDLKAGGRVAWQDMGLLRRVSGRDVRGFLGMKFLKKHVVRVDFDEGLLAFLRPDGQEHPEWGPSVPLTYDKFWPESLTTKVTVPGAGEVEVLVDTGSNATGLAPELFGKAFSEDRLFESFGATLAGNMKVRNTRLKSLSLGPFRHDGILCSEGISVLGLDVLSRYVITFDFPAGKMYLKKGKGFDRVDELDMSGLHVWRVDGKIAAPAVDQDSPAEKAGIKGGDVILKVGDKPTAEIDLWDLRDLLKSGDGKEIRMTVKRGEAEKAVSFKLKKRI